MAVKMLVAGKVEKDVRSDDEDGGEEEEEMEVSWLCVRVCCGGVCVDVGGS